MSIFKKTSLRRTRLRKDIAAERFARMSRLFSANFLISLLLGLIFVTLSVLILAFELIQQSRFIDVIPIAVVVVMIFLGAGFYIHHYQRRIIENHMRAVALLIVLIFLLAITKVGSISSEWTIWGTGTAAIAAIILTIVYDQRFAIGMSIIYCLLACFAVDLRADTGLFLTMAAGAVTCCFALKEIRKRNKLLEVSALSATVVFTAAVALGFLSQQSRFLYILNGAGLHAAAAFLAGAVIELLLPLIEKLFRIATSMTLIHYSDNNPLLKRLAMEAPGTNSHSTLVGEIAEAAAEAVGCNGLLCRVGARYHDIGKINKPGYFVENQIGPTSRHKELSPAMSQLIIVGHVKDGVEMAKEYKLPAVLRQFIETHHGTTLIEYFYNEAKKQQADKQAPPSESEFRYPGPKPATKEEAIVMLADSIEGAVRSLPEVSPTKIETVVHNMTMKRLQDGQFDECDLTLRELSKIEMSISKSLIAHYHGRIAYPTAPDQVQDQNTGNSK